MEDNIHELRRTNQRKEQVKNGVRLSESLGWEEEQDMRLIDSEVAGNSIALVHHSSCDAKSLAN